MLNIEIIKFEAQDVITASTAAVCTCEPGANHPGNATHCNHENCEYTGKDHNCNDYVC